MPPNRSQRSRLHGSIYLHVLATSLLITILGMGSLLAVRIQMRTARLQRDCAEARVGAASAVELGLLYVRQDSNWRTVRPNGVWFQDKALGTCQITLEGVDPTDGMLSDCIFEPLVLTGTGTRGTARHKTQVTLVPVVKPLETLKTCLHASGQITVNNAKLISVLGAPLSSNWQLVNSGTIDGNVEVKIANPVGTITGTLTQSAPAKSMPAACVLDNLASRATVVPYAATIEKAVLTPGCNPWGPTDPNGLYLIDTGGNAITIKKARIHGTLIIRAPSKTVTLDDAVFMQSYRSDFPTLLVEGNLVIKTHGVAEPLSESANGTNYNPVGAPYEDVYDDDTLDTYPNEIRGLVHIVGALSLEAAARIVGTVVCDGAATCDGANSIVYDPGLYACPPAGYTFVERMAIAPSSWRQVVD
jgi:hypothetical protein